MLRGGLSITPVHEGLQTHWECVPGPSYSKCSWDRDSRVTWEPIGNAAFWARCSSAPLESQSAGGGAREISVNSGKPGLHMKSHSSQGDIVRPCLKMKEKKKKPDVESHCVILVLGKLRQGDCYQLRGSLRYRVSYRTARGKKGSL